MSQNIYKIPEIKCAMKCPLNTLYVNFENENHKGAEKNKSKQSALL